MGRMAGLGRQQRERTAEASRVISAPPAHRATRTERLSGYVHGLCFPVVAPGSALLVAAVYI